MFEFGDYWIMEYWNMGWCNQFFHNDDANTEVEDHEYYAFRLTPAVKPNYDPNNTIEENQNRFKIESAYMEEYYAYNILMSAIYRGCLKCVKIALKDVKDINCKPLFNSYGDKLKGRYPPLFAAIRMGNISIIKLLIDAGADINILDDDDKNIGQVIKESKHDEVERYFQGI